MRLPDLSFAQTAELFPPNMILAGYVGSTAYGMSRPDSDKDVKGICIGPIESYLGLSTFEHKEVARYGYDCFTYELRKYVKLLMTANPTVLELLWLNQNHYVLRTELGNLLIANRQKFITKKCFHSFTGYAYGQLYRLDHAAPTGQLGEKRKKLVQEFGYDTKNAAHAIRLLNMGIEVLMDGQLYVDRSKKDARYLLDIRAGMYTLDAIKAEAKRLQDLAQEAYVKSELPKQCDFKEIERMVMDMIKSQEVQEAWDG